MQKLHSRGKNAEDLDLTPQLLVTYMACGTNDTPFYRYIESLENKSNDGDINLTTKVLMDKAETKYEELKDKNKFNANHTPSLQEKGDDIVALQAQIAELKKLGNPRANRRSSRGLPEWVTKKPTDDKVTKEMNGKTYHWCEGDSGKNHSPKWVIHKPSECTHLKKTPQNTPDDRQKETTAAPTWSTSMLATLQADDAE
jgi:hypothetical protein